jgi:hypothetical protein
MFCKIFDCGLWKSAEWRILSKKALNMNKIKLITVPTPCHQSWQQMETATNGRNCGHCAKIVVDFTKMTNDEILGYLATTQHVCGRFNEFQLPGINYQLDLENRSKKLGWKKWVAAVGLLGTSLVNKAVAQTTPANHATSQQNSVDNSQQLHMPGKIAVVDTNVQHINGVVIGADDKLPVVGAYVKIKGTNKGIQTDSQGRFKLTVGDIRATLVISYIGYQTREMEVSTSNSKDLNITMQPSQAILGDIVIETKPPQSRVLMFYQYVPWPINRLFK